MRNHKSLLLLLLVSCICQAQERIFPRNLMTFPGKDFSEKAKFSWSWIKNSRDKSYRVLTVEEGAEDITLKKNMRIQPYPYLHMIDKAFNGYLFGSEPKTVDNNDGTTTTLNAVTFKNSQYVPNVRLYVKSFDVFPIPDIYEFHPFNPFNLVGTDNFTQELPEGVLFNFRYIKMDNRNIASYAITLETPEECGESD